MHKLLSKYLIHKITAVRFGTFFFCKIKMMFQSKINTQIKSRNHSRFWSIYREALESTHYSKVRLTTVTYQLQACDGYRQTDVEVLCQCHNTNPPQTILQLSCYRVKITLVAAFTPTESVQKMEIAAGSPEAFTACTCVCVSLCFQVREADPFMYNHQRTSQRHRKKKEQKASWHFLHQHGHSTISNKHRKMLTHNFYCSIIRRQFTGNIATYIMVGLSQGLQNYFQFLK